MRRTTAKATRKPVRPEAAGGGADGKQLPRYLQRFLEVAESLPAEELARLPKHAAENLDHYVYGIPKRKADAE